MATTDNANTQQWSLDADHASMCHGPVCAVVWRGATTQKAIADFKARCLEHAKANPNGICVVGIVEDCASMPGTAERKAASNANHELRRAGTKALATLIPGNGFLAAWARGVATAMHTMANNSYPHRVFKTAPDCCNWFSSMLPTPTNAESCAQAIEDFRKHFERMCTQNTNRDSTGPLLTQ